METKHTGLLRAFVELGVEFAIVGGVAVNAHGYIRATRDLEVFFRPTEDNAKLAFLALAKVGAPIAGLDWDDLLNDEEHLRYGTPEEYVDILSSIGEMSFDQVWQQRVDISCGGVDVPFISKADLIENKRQTGRHRDLADVEELERIP